MSVVIDQVAGRVEPPPGPGAGTPAPEPAPPQEPQARDLPRQLRQLDRRRLRLQAD